MLIYFIYMYFFFFLMIRRPPRSTQSRSSAASDVYKRQVCDLTTRDDREAFGEPRRLLAPVRLEQPDHDVAPGVLLSVPLEDHPVRLSHPGCHPAEYAQTPAPRLGAPGGRCVLFLHGRRSLE